MSCLLAGFGAVLFIGFVLMLGLAIVINWMEAKHK